MQSIHDTDRARLIRRYAEHRGYVGTRGGIRNTEGRVVARSWDDFAAYVWRNNLLDSYWDPARRRVVWFIELVSPLPREA